MMASVGATLLLVIITVVMHYEMLRRLSSTLPRLCIRPRAKLLAVVFSAFSAHAVEIALYGIAFYLLTRAPHPGTLGQTHLPPLSTCLYFSAETFTSLGFGDVIPGGPLRMLAGAECLNGLLLIGWSASYIYISMERFWTQNNGDDVPSRR
jgi:hypothetical protein